MPTRLITAFVLLFLHAPLVVLMVNSVNGSRFGGEWEGFTWKWYERLWEADEVWESLWLTLKIAVLSSLAAMVLGTLAAWVLHQFRSRLQTVHQGLVTLPLALPDLLMGMSLLALFVALGVETGMMTIWIAHVTFCVSYVTLVVLGRLQDFDFTLLDAARDLGASRGQTVRRVLLPLLLPGILAGGLLAFTLSMDDYVITFFVSGPGTTTLPLRVASMMKTSRNLPVINALSTLMIIATFLLAAASFRLQRSRGH
ncbi:spermidine/putrescine transport system permease protein [Prosthecobacter fusiformis]|uniref:Spermidine/putrescine transport system permease protein n=1 Tax=Prosthecobacter fusiformis TaxID=48464 RepID=A0A4R7RIE2_9BACT|nr:ABC transporter permease [Prosthecobacter fusiformis]TDU62493.1 spermidine/putrescine transport system permease protein [Prosthecobacter fusiformis]